VGREWGNGIIFRVQPKACLGPIVRGFKTICGKGVNDLKHLKINKLHGIVSRIGEQFRSI